MAFSYFRTITIDHTKVGNGTENLSNFAVLVSETNNSLKSIGNGGNVQSSNGYDIYFYSDRALTTRIPAERELYNASTGQYIGWVKISSLSHTTDTVIYMAYGDSSISSDPNSDATYGATSTWDSSFVMVTHENETGTNPTIRDSTSNGNNSSVNTWTPTASGKFGPCGQLVSGTNHIEFPDSASFDSINTNNAFTLSIWINWTASTEAYNSILGRYTSGVGGSELLIKSNGKLALYVNTAGNNIDGTGAALSTGTWYYIAGVFSTAGAVIYVNGSPDSTAAYAHPCGTTAALNMTLGHDGFGSGRYFRGYFEEARIANVARSIGWVKTEYNNQNSPSTFYTLGSENATIGYMTPGRIW